MGEVYRARDLRLERGVALKFLPASVARQRAAIDRFFAEARAASALNHPNIVTIHEIDESPDGPFIVMELVDGQTLRTMTGQPNPLETVVKLGKQAARALSVAHAAGILHRDIKPENIMVRRDGIIKLVDFGLARLTSTAALTSEVDTVEGTEPGTLIGSLRYMSPEQAQNDLLTPASDIFSLGLVLYELVTGLHPFQAETPLGVLSALVSQPAVPPSRLIPGGSPAFDALLLKMLAKEPALRPTASEVERTLSANASIQALPAQLPKRSGVGREKEHAQLREAFDLVAANRGLLFCIAGEPGLGKTSLVEEFLAELPEPTIVARGRCSERLAGGEAYLPLLEALDSLLHGDDRESVLPALRLMAPTWYAQLVPSAGANASGKAVTQEHMQRELANFFKEISRLSRVVVFVDDLQWADISTIDLLSYLGTKFDSIRILLVVTYRLEDMLLAKHPFMAIRRDLQARSSCREISLDFLSRQDVERYLSTVFSENQFPRDLIALIHEKTEGNPLFMVDLTRYLSDRGVIVQRGTVWTLAQAVPDIERELPESIRSMIERKIDRLSDDDRRLMVAASVQGHEFDSAVVAKVLNCDAGELEDRLAALERVHVFVRLIAEHDFPDGTPTLRYRFVHVLYQNVLYASLKATRRVALNAAVAQALLAYYGERSAEVATQLAVLFENGRNFGRAVFHFWLAAEHAVSVSAYPEALVLARRGLGLLKSSPNTDDRTERELKLLITLGVPLTALQGFTAPEVAAVYGRAQELYRKIERKTPDLFPALLGLLRFHLLQGAGRTAHELAGELLALAESSQDPSLFLESHRALGVTSFYLGALTPAFKHLEDGTRYSVIKRQQQHRSSAFADAVSAEVICTDYAVLASWLLGRPDQALQKSQQAVNLAQGLSDPYSLAVTLTCAAVLHQFRGEIQRAQDFAEAIRRLSASEHSFPMYSAFATILRGWAVASHKDQEQEGILEMREGLSASASMGPVWRPYFMGILADAYRAAGEIDHAQEILEEAWRVVERTSERWWEAELCRLDGQLLLMQGASESEVEARFRRALDVARHQDARSLELRAGMSLYDLWRRHGKSEQAHELLTDAYGHFSEGFDTADLKHAMALLTDSRSQ